MKHKDFEELTNLEYRQLQVFHKLNEYKRLKSNELSFDKGYSKNDILWSIYNEQKDVYIRKKDYAMAGVVYKRMYELLYREKKYEKALEYLICFTYLRTDLTYFNSEKTKLEKKGNVALTSEIIKSSISTYLPSAYDEFEVSWFQEHMLSTKDNALMRTN